MLWEILYAWRERGRKIVLGGRVDSHALGLSMFQQLTVDNSSKRHVFGMYQYLESNRYETQSVTIMTLHFKKIQ